MLPVIELCKNGIAVCLAFLLNVLVQIFFFNAIYILLCDYVKIYFSILALMDTEVVSRLGQLEPHCYACSHGLEPIRTHFVGNIHRNRALQSGGESASSN